ncbi:MAG TPA: sigma-70 family RNA polymerase sigma factor [Actinophytocola sp.]|uniref:RNA polymerase sigma factor n=1 Tax=Actinophytocola sp. TaxID=1872138 RepID=UPI002DDDB2E9|nr:sigma-70 family RNA polymerase sigma factor [Actinophytocola sp.]HEV2780812.1 sigma-70 family RNA polymerase sigma factor [Actinophytocola sp.]
MATAEDEGWRDAVSPGPVEAVQEDAAFKEFFVRCWEPVRLAVSMRVADERFVEDEVQEAFLLARRNWDQLRHFDKPEWWVLKVALRRIGRILARERRPAVPIRVPATTDPIATIAENERVYAAIRQLPRRQAEAIILFTLGHSVAASAEILGVTPGSVKKHRYLARKRLRAMLAGGTR